MSALYEHRHCSGRQMTIEEWEELFSRQVEYGEIAHCPDCGEPIYSEDELRKVRPQKNRKFNGSYEDFCAAQSDLFVS